VEQGLSFSLCRWSAGLRKKRAKKTLLGGVAALGGCDDGGCDDGGCEDGALWQCCSIAVDADGRDEGQGRPGEGLGALSTGGCNHRCSRGVVGV
jgi:hypothetical protein